MPLSDDPKTNESAKDILGVFKDLAGGPKPGFRPAHAKGLLVQGTFVPTPAAASLSRAPHFTNAAGTPVLVRFSSSSGHPTLPDSDPNGNPRAIALRFVLAETPRRKHTDIIGHSVPFFPAATPDEALAFFRAVKGAGTDPDTLTKHIAAHPAAQAFLAAPKPTPTAFAHEAFYALHAFKFTNADGKATYVRYRIVPVAGHKTLDADAAKAQPADFLYDGVRAQLAQGSGHTIEYDLVAQVAQDGDVTDDSSVHWPEEGPDARQLVTLGRVTLDRLYGGGGGGDEAAEQKYLIFDPVPRVDGVEASADPLIDLRAAVYIISGKERRAA
ncbi:catalase [Sporothrix schenckii 1099-18]|uniref:Catalase core domain-containing protein n=2 Tax=Sporothrix schenckii TaxID=29908 RepID=U7Q0U7_SPOS1|nr:catalase [Sporothrix schenckii 1099-18]ERT00817.1 hypothetical protein HMPREF1624_02050 [Sporothrix schenckii ATCC 58251]KJR87906.1 catalase [Sporothrix schenckii 1099-18]